MAKKTRKTTTTAPSAKASKSGPAGPAIVGEKRVKKTGGTVPVGPAKRKRGMHDGPTKMAAVDRRRQITGTDELPNAQRSKMRRGGNPGRGPVGLPGKV